MLKKCYFGVDAIDGQVRPDGLADVVYACLEDLVRLDHALGPDRAKVPRSLSRPHSQQVKLTSNNTLDRRLVLDGVRVEEGTKELKCTAERAVECPRQLRPVSELTGDEKFVDVVEYNVLAGRHLSVETVLDGQRLSVVPDAIGDRFRKSPVYDVDPTSTIVATSGGVMMKHTARSL